MSRKGQKRSLSTACPQCVDRVLCSLVIMLLSSALLFPGAARGERIASTRYGSAWVVYWDTSGGITESILHEHRFSKLIYFAAYFGADDVLVLPPELEKMKSDLDLMLMEPKEAYLSIVNDLQLDDGSFLLKDKALLERLLTQSGEKRRRLAGRLIRAAQAGRFQGIEIDFEGLLEDLSLWRGMQQFIEELHRQSSEADLGLRVLLEPRTPFGDLRLPQGPEYVMMCYNLFGPHGGPGPKANDAFLREQVRKMSHIPADDRTFALALGGFSWSGREVTQLTYQQAEALRAQHSAKIDRVDGVATFSYRSSNGARHEVWYADEVTLAHWTKVLNEAGEYSIDLWRLGGNLSPTVELPPNR